jgi:hypothetical protein
MAGFDASDRAAAQPSVGQRDERAAPVDGDLCGDDAGGGVGAEECSVPGSASAAARSAAERALNGVAMGAGDRGGRISAAVARSVRRKGKRPAWRTSCLAVRAARCHAAPLRLRLRIDCG